MKPTHNVQVWSCGGGTQSGAIAALIATGKLPKPDICLMIDTRRERSSTWPFVHGFIEAELAKVELALDIVPRDEFATVDLLSASGDVLLPGYTSQGGDVGKLPGWCSNEWKQRPARRWLRSKGIESARLWMGISRDEMNRVRTSDVYWLRVWYPLIFEIPMSRSDCTQLIRSRGWTGNIPHSACWMCPNANDNEWRDMKANSPDDFKSACDLETVMRAHDPHFWLHPSCRPLAEVDFDAQYTMFTDRGCTGGCFT